MSPDGVPDWLPEWCLDHLGNRPAAVLFRHRSMSAVFGLRLADGTTAVVKARPGGKVLHGDSPEHAGQAPTSSDGRLQEVGGHEPLVLLIE